MSGARYFRSLARCTRCHRQTLNGFLSLAGLQAVVTSQASRTVKALSERLPVPRRYGTTSRGAIQSESDQNLHDSSQAERQAAVDQELEEILTSDAAGEETFDDIQRSVQEREAEIYAKAAEEDAEYEDVKAYGEEGTELVSQEDIIETDNTSEMPWYLREEEEDSLPITPMAERQRIPDPPENAPSNLGAILERLSTDIGLDYLTIIDLRGLDPPPALGSGVIMVIGTARSEKHLHVSGDRFARWLRSAYKLTPNADGLLGRNELKLKLRRKAKRAKLLGSVGVMPNPDEDDGTRAGWICIDAGVIERTESAERSLDESGIVGFGGQIDGTKLIVQMMTEDKRREIDLESLWGRALEKQRIRRERSQAVETEEDDNGSAILQTEQLATIDPAFSTPQDSPVSPS